MTDGPQKDAPSPEGKNNALNTWLAVVGVLLMLEFGVPGFIIGLIARCAPAFLDAHSKAVKIIFYPAIRLSDASPATARFYTWEVSMAAGGNAATP